MDPFTVDISRFIGKCKANADILVRKTGIALYQGVTTRNPVAPHNGGRSRANWRPAVNDIDLTTDENIKLDATRAMVTFTGANSGDELNISNNLPYVERLENGYSRQAPQGMVRITVQDVKEKLERGEIKA